MGSLNYIIEDELLLSIKKGEYNEVDVIERIASEGEEFLSSLMTCFYHDSLVVSGSSKTMGFKFSSTSLLWVECDVKEVIKTMVPRTLHPILTYLGDFISENPNDAIHESKVYKMTSAIEKLKNTVMNDTGKGRIANSAYPHLRKAEFADKLNKFGDVLPVKGGNIVNIKTREIRKRNKDDLFTKEIPVFYDGTAGTMMPVVEKFVSDIMLDIPERVKFMKQLCGYFLSADNKKQLFFIFLGDGSNGKGTLIRMFDLILEGLTYSAPNELIEQAGKKTNLRKDYIYELDGKRLMTFNEIEEDGGNGNVTLNETQLKRLTGDDKFSADAKYKGVKEFYSQAKPVIACNEAPILSGSKAINCRGRLIPFEASFVYEPKRANERLRIDDFSNKTIKTEEFKTSFLHFCLEGYAEFLANGEEFDTPEDFLAKEKEYKESANTVLQFAEMLEDDESEGKSKNDGVQCMFIFNIYTSWCEKEKKKPMSLTLFGIAMKGKFSHFKYKNNVFYKVKVKKEFEKSVILPVITTK